MFDSLIGNGQVKTMLARLIDSDRLPQSSIFVGKNGIGKKQFALEIAKTAVCREPENLSPCNTCSRCKRATEFNLATSGKKDDYERVFFSEHPDIGLVIPNKQTIYIDAIRDLEREANFRPFEATARFFIIDEAEKMSPQASNALLKTLEEPAETTHIFLITSSPSSLPATIHSRCQTMRFSPIKKDDIERFLIDQKQYLSQDAKLIANISRGSIGSALNLDLDRFRSQREQMLEVIETLAGGKHFASLLRASEEMNSAKDKDEFEDYLSILQTLIHDVWKLNTSETGIVTNIDLDKQLRGLSISNQRLTKWLEEIETLRENLRSNLNRKIAADSLFMKMAG